MATDRTIIEQTREEQRRVFRIACDPNRYGLTLKAIGIDAQIGYDSLRGYASGETEMPLSALRRLVGVIPDELLSFLLPGDRVIVRAPDEINHDEIAPILREYLRCKDEAHHPESEAGRDIGPSEDKSLRVKLVAVAGGR